MSKRDIGMEILEGIRDNFRLGRTHERAFVGGEHIADLAFRSARRQGTKDVGSSHGASAGRRRNGRQTIEQEMVGRNVVEVSAGLRLGRRLVRRSVCGRGYSKHVSKCPREGFVGLESRLQRGLSYGFAGELQVSRGALHPQPPNMLL